MSNTIGVFIILGMFGLILAGVGFYSIMEADIQFQTYIVPQLYNKLNVNNTDVQNLKVIESICAFDRPIVLFGLLEQDCLNKAKEWYKSRYKV